MAEPHPNGPNILITGTPGTGKTLLAKELAQATGLNYLSVDEIARENNFYLEYNEETECYEIDEDKVMDEMEDQMKEGNNVVDHYQCDFFPERWFDAVFVLRTDNTLLFERLEKRGYNQQRIQDNVQCEIFQSALDEAHESYNEEIVYELVSNTPEDMDDNLNKLNEWIDAWKRSHQ